MIHRIKSLLKRSRYPLIGLFLGAELVAADPVEGESEFIRMRAEFGKMEAVAGFPGSGANGFNWEASREGGSAIEADLSRPHMTMADAVGNLYIADKESHAIRKVDLNGVITTVAGVSADTDTQALGNGPDSGVATEVKLSSPNGLFTMPDGTTYILDTGNHKIRKLSPDGQISLILRDPSGVGAGRGLWVSSDESVIFYCTGNVVKRWTPSGGIEVYATGFLDLANIDVDPTDGTLVVTDRDLHRAYRIVEEGALPFDGTANPIAGNGSIGRGQSGVPALQCSLEKLRGIAFRQDGTYFLASQESGRIWFVDSGGIITLLIDGDSSRSTHAGNGELLSTSGRKISEPRAIALAPNGDLLITENDLGIIRRVTNRCIPLEISEFQFSTTPLIRWKSHREGTYRVDHASSLNDWKPLMTIPGSNGAETMVEDSSPDALRRFYRVVDVTTP